MWLGVPIRNTWRNPLVAGSDTFARCSKQLGIFRPERFNKRFVELGGKSGKSQILGIMPEGEIVAVVKATKELAEDKSLVMRKSDGDVFTHVVP